MEVLYEVPTTGFYMSDRTFRNGNVLASLTSNFDFVVSYDGMSTTETILDTKDDRIITKHHEYEIRPTTRDFELLMFQTFMEQLAAIVTYDRRREAMVVNPQGG